MPIDSHLPQADPFSLVPTFKIKNFLQIREEAVELEAQIGRLKRTMLEDSARASERLATMNASKEMCQGQIRYKSFSVFDIG